ncbi:MAG: hypothetical protein ACYTFT_07810, partial [Planctomycetota bacterium]
LQSLWLTGSLLAALSACCVSGCASDRPARLTDVQSDDQAAAAVRAASGWGPLYSLPDMQDATYHREVGARSLERAYRSRVIRNRETNFKIAFGAFEQAQESYHAALVEAPARYGPVIESEIEQVASYMRQIRRDRQPSWGP